MRLISHTMPYLYHICIYFNISELYCKNSLIKIQLPAVGNPRMSSSRLTNTVKNCIKWKVNKIKTFSIMSAQISSISSDGPSLTYCDYKVQCDTCGHLAIYPPRRPCLFWFSINSVSNSCWRPFFVLYIY